MSLFDFIQIKSHYKYIHMSDKYYSLLIFYHYIEIFFFNFLILTNHLRFLRLS